MIRQLLQVLQKVNLLYVPSTESEMLLYWHSQVSPQGGIVVLSGEHPVYLLCWMT